MYQSAAAQVARAGQTLVPKEGNPNVYNVFAPSSTDFSDVIGAAVGPRVVPDYRPSLRGMDEEDMPPR